MQLLSHVVFLAFFPFFLFVLKQSRLNDENVNIYLKRSLVWKENEEGILCNVKENEQEISSQVPVKSSLRWEEEESVEESSCQASITFFSPWFSFNSHPIVFFFFFVIIIPISNFLDFFSCKSLCSSSLSLYTCCFLCSSLFLSKSHHLSLSLSLARDTHRFLVILMWLLSSLLLRFRGKEKRREKSNEMKREWNLCSWHFALFFSSAEKKTDESQAESDVIKNGSSSSSYSCIKEWSEWERERQEEGAKLGSPEKLVVWWERTNRRILTFSCCSRQVSLSWCF